MNHAIFLLSVTLLFFSCNNDSALDGVWFMVGVSTMEKNAEIHEPDRELGESKLLHFKGDSVCLHWVGSTKPLNFEYFRENQMLLTVQHDTLGRIIYLGNDTLVVGFSRNNYRYKSYFVKMHERDFLESDALAIEKMLVSQPWALEISEVSQLVLYADTAQTPFEYYDYGGKNIYYIHGEEEYQKNCNAWQLALINDQMIFSFTYGSQNMYGVMVVHDFSNEFLTGKLYSREVGGSEICTFKPKKILSEKEYGKRRESLIGEWSVEEILSPSPVCLKDSISKYHEGKKWHPKMTPILEDKDLITRDLKFIITVDNLSLHAQNKQLIKEERWKLTTDGATVLLGSPCSKTMYYTCVNEIGIINIEFLEENRLLINKKLAFKTSNDDMVGCITVEMVLKKQ